MKFLAHFTCGDAHSKHSNNHTVEGTVERAGVKKTNQQ